MSAFVQVLSDQEMAIKACGRACADMLPQTLPAVQISAPLSLSAVMREHPEFEFDAEWLASLDASPTVH